MANTNTLHAQNMMQPEKDNIYGHKYIPRDFPDANKSIMTKNGKGAKRLTISEAKKLILKAQRNGRANGNIIVEFKTEKEGLKIAKSFANLCANPLIAINVTFKKIEDEN